MKQRSPLGIVFLVVFLDLLAFGIVIPQIGVYAKLYGADGWLQGLIIAAYSMMQFLCAPALGRWSDRVGRRPVLLLSVLAAAVGHLIFAFAGGVAGLLLARVVNGLGGANISVAQAAIADVTPPERRTKAMGLIGAAFGLGFIFGPALGGMIGHWGTDRWGTSGGNLAIGVLAAGFSVLCALLIALRLPETLPPEHRQTEAGHAKLLDVATLTECLRHPALSRLMAIFLISTAGFAVLHAIMSYFVMDRTGLSVNSDDGVRAAQLATAKVFAWIGLIAAIVQGGAMGSLVKRFGETRLLRGGLVLMVAGLACQPLAAGLTQIMAISTLQAVGNALLAATLPSLISLHSPPDRRGEVLGVSHSLGSLGRIGGPLAGGLLYDLGASVPFWVGAGLCAVAAVIAFGLPRDRPDDEPVAPAEIPA